MDRLPQALRSLSGSISLEREPGGQVLFLRGDVDSAVVVDFQIRHGRAPVVVDAIDAGAVTFVGSAGLALMVRCAEASVAAAQQPVLRATSPPMDRLLEQVGMDHLFVRP